VNSRRPRILLLALLGLLSLASGCRPFVPSSDDFNTCAVNEARWTFVDPRGDSTAQIVGGGTGDAQLQISVPAGSEHDPWGVNHSARLMQPILDAASTAFTVRAKFDSPVAGAFAIQGLMVEASAVDWLRFDVYSDGTGTNLFAGTVVNGVGQTRLNQAVAVTFPLYLELRRQGDQWTVSHSEDGQTWVQDASFSHAMVATSIGVFAGNDGPNPAHTAVVDYFWSSAVPLVLAQEDQGPVPDPSQLSVLVSGSGTVDQTPPPPVGGYTCGAQVALTAQADPGWVFDGWYAQASGTQNPLNVTLAAPRSVLASFSRITTPPTISGIAIEVTEATAQVTWTTNHPSTSTVDYGETTSYELGTVDDPTLVQSHSVLISGLAPGTTHHLQITSENGAGFAASSADQVFVTLAVPPSTGIVSEDFNVCALDPGTWTFVDPLLDASYAVVGGGTGDAQLQINVPAGTKHDPFGTNDAPRLMQSVPDGDFEIEAKFDSPVTQNVQLQGVVAEENSTNFVRFDVFSDGTGTRAYGGVAVAGSGQTKFNVAIPSTFPVTLRLRRQGNQWTASHSFDGTSFVVDGIFTHAIAVSGVGVQAGNQGGKPAFTSLVDWFAATASPIADEDGAILPAENTLSLFTSGSGSVLIDPDQALYVCGETVSLEALAGSGSYFTGWSGDLSGAKNPDVLVMNVDRAITANFAPVVGPPTISGLAVAGVTESTATIHWSTNHPSDSVVDYGETSGYELGPVSDPVLVTSHNVVLTGLTPNTPYHFRVSSTNEISLTATSGDQVFITQTAGGPGGPLIQVWYGDQQYVGDPGVAQPFFNVLGNVLDADGVASLSYTLNGASSAPLNIGPDQKRLAGLGDFNIELPIASLVPGLNTVAITALDGMGEATNHTVLVDYLSGNVWPENYVIDWNQVQNLQDVAQVVDGNWEVANGILRPLQVGYDRLVAVGDATWVDYEVVVPITIHGYSPDGFLPGSNRPGVGLLMRWVSHLPPGQPQHNFRLGAIGFYRIDQDGTGKLEMWTEDSKATPGLQRTLAYEVPYVFKMQVETLASSHQYRFKVWEQGQPEPPAWDLVEDQALSEPSSGALVLVAHHMDVSFGTVTVTPLP